MEMMKAVVCRKYGPPEVLEITQRRKPVPKRDEVCIKIFATSVTNSDIFIRSSKVEPHLLIPFRLMMGLTKPRNPVIGEVFAGVIESVGPTIQRFKPGDQVYGLTGFSLGAYADYLCMREKDSKRGCLARKPKNITFEEATSAAYGGLLAFQAFDRASIARGASVLIYGASGTSGVMAVQYAENLGALVTGVCGPLNLDFVKSLGAHKVLDYTTSESIQSLEEYDYVFDMVGNAKTSEVKKACKAALSARGSFISIDDGALVLDSGRLSRITALVESGNITPINDRVYPFEQIIAAHRYVETGHKKGNVAITVNC